MANIGSLDRTLRFILGTALLASLFLPHLSGKGIWPFALAAVGLVLLATAAFRVCPAYSLLGIRTCPLNKT